MPHKHGVMSEFQDDNRKKMHSYKYLYLYAKTSRHYAAGVAGDNAADAVLGGN